MLFTWPVMEVFAAPCYASYQADTETQIDAELESNPVLDTPWRYTKFGWQDSTKWFRIDSKVEDRILDRVHPMMWAANILLAAIGAAVWASDEWQVARLLGHPVSERQESEREKLRP